MLPMITVCILAKNSASTIEKTLASVQTFAEVVLLDNGSCDDTVAIARQYPNVRVISHPFIGFGPLRNVAASHALNDWILALDTDEELSDALIQEIASLPLNAACAYSISRHNFYNGRHIKGCGWYPDRVIRLYHRKTAHYSDSQVHESVKGYNINITPLASPIFHVPFRSTAEFLAKMEHYSTLYALQHKHKKKSSPAKAVLHSVFSFIRSYFFQKGFLLGAEGFIVSLYSSNTVFYKYIKLWETNKTA